MLLPPAAAGAGRPPGPLSVLSGVVRSGGLRGLWLGQTGTLIRETGGGVAWFGSKEAVMRLLLARDGGDGRRAPVPWESALAGACAPSGRSGRDERSIASGKRRSAARRPMRICIMPS